SRVVAANALEEWPRPLRPANLRVTADRVLARLAHQRSLRPAAAPRGLVDQGDERFQRLFVILAIEMDPARLVGRIAIDARRRELADLVIELERGLHVLLLEEVFAEREIRVRDVFRLGMILDQSLEERAGEVLALLLGEEEREIEQHLVHPSIGAVAG